MYDQKISPDEIIVSILNSIDLSYDHKLFRHFDTVNECYELESILAAVPTSIWEKMGYEKVTSVSVQRYTPFESPIIGVRINQEVEMPVYLSGFDAFWQYCGDLMGSTVRE